MSDDSKGRLFYVEVVRTFGAYVVAESREKAEEEAIEAAEEMEDDGSEPDEYANAREVTGLPPKDEWTELPYGTLARKYDNRTVKEWHDIGEELRKAEAIAKRDAAAQVPLAFGVAK